jgi:hypothetical protein
MAIFIYSPFSSIVHEWLKHEDPVLVSHKLAATSWILFEVCGPAYRTNLRITMRNWCKPVRTALPHFRSLTAGNDLVTRSSPRER